MTATLSEVPRSARFALGPSYRLAYLQWIQQMQPDPGSATLLSEPSHGFSYTLRPYTSCTCGSPRRHLEQCPPGLPNLHVPAANLKVYWYGAAMRGAWSNRPLTVAQFARVLAWVQQVERQRTLSAGARA